jgi:hypothetical protein
MLDYARHRVMEMLKIACQVIFVTSGPAGLRAGEYPCQAVGLELYLLLPATCDHLFNLETNPKVILMSAAWELQGEAHVILQDATATRLELSQRPEAKLCRLVRIDPIQMQVRRQAGWGSLETIDL